MHAGDSLKKDHPWEDFAKGSRKMDAKVKRLLCRAATWATQISGTDEEYDALRRCIATEDAIMQMHSQLRTEASALASADAMALDLAEQGAGGSQMYRVIVASASWPA